MFILKGFFFYRKVCFFVEIRGYFGLELIIGYVRDFIVGFFMWLGIFLRKKVVMTGFSIGIG